MQNEEEYVRAGATVLDMRLPEWARMIDQDTLNMSDLYRCILGQCYENYSAGLRALDIPLTEALRHGFDRHPGEPSARLTATWLDEIRRRLAV